MLTAPTFYRDGVYIIPNAISLDNTEGNKLLLDLIRVHERSLVLNILGARQYGFYESVVQYHVYDKYGPEHLQDNFCIVLDDADDSTETALRTTPGFNEPTIQSSDWVELFYGEGRLEDVVRLYVYAQWLRVDEIKPGVSTYGRGTNDAVTSTDTNQLFSAAFNEYVLAYHDCYDFISQSDVFNTNPDSERIGDILTTEFGYRPRYTNPFGL